MIHLSKLTLNPTNRGVFRLLKTPYHTHAAIMRAFPPCDKNEPKPCDWNGRILFRVEPSSPATGPITTVLVQSLIPPDWEVLVTELGNGIRVEQRIVKPEFQIGQKFRFRLRANPTFRCFKETENRKKGQRYGVYGDDNLFDWLNRKGQPESDGKRGGFSISKNDLRIVDEGKWTAWREESSNETEPDFFQADLGEKTPEKNTGPVNVYTVLFEGRLTVTQPDALLETLKFGIGSAKGFGCGLLSLARA